jgi:hypothetical protein
LEIKRLINAGYDKRVRINLNKIITKNNIIKFCLSTFKKKLLESKVFDLKYIIIGFIRYTISPSNKDKTIIKIAVTTDLNKLRLKNLKIDVSNFIIKIFSKSTKSYSNLL